MNMFINIDGWMDGWMERSTKEASERKIGKKDMCVVGGSLSRKT